MRQSLLTPDVVSRLLVLACRAGEAVMEVYAQWGQHDASSGRVSYKEDHSPVTEADIRAHKVLVAGLADISPDIPVVSEEDADTMRYRTQSGRFWLIDPLDGTREFIARNDEFTVNIALVEDSVAVFGIVLAPALDALYWGDSSGAYRRVAGVETRITALTGDAGYPLRVVASRSHANAETRQYVESLGRCEQVQAGSSLKFCRIAEGAADIYPRLGPTCEWDTAAGQAIVEAAGGSVNTLDGVRLVYGKADVLNPFFVVQGKHNESGA